MAIQIYIKRDSMWSGNYNDEKTINEESKKIIRVSEDNIERIKL